jgi:hypothetical protein
MTRGLENIMLSMKWKNQKIVYYHLKASRKKATQGDCLGDEIMKILTCNLTAGLLNPYAVHLKILIIYIIKLSEIH